MFFQGEVLNSKEIATVYFKFKVSVQFNTLIIKMSLDQTCNKRRCSHKMTKTLHFVYIVLFETEHFQFQIKQ